MPAKNPVDNNLKEVVTRASGHVAVATLPDVCLVPPKKEALPFDNWVVSKQIKKYASFTVSFGGAGVCLALTEWGPNSEPAHAGTLGGKTSGGYRGYARALSYSRDLKVEGLPVVRKDDLTAHNHKGSAWNTTGVVVNAAELAALLAAKYGRLVDEFCPLLAGHSAASKRLIDVLPTVQRKLNAIGAKAKVPISVSQAELATNFLAEGGNLAVAQNTPDSVSGYGHMGIDSMLTPKPDAQGNFHLNPLYRGWIDGSVTPSYSDPANVKRDIVNDAPKHPAKVAAPEWMTLEQGAYANGGIYAAGKARAAADMQARGIDFGALPAEAQFYWATVYYNAGWGGGAGLLDAKGVNWYQHPWTKAEDWYSQLMALPEKQRKLDYAGELAHYNALKRTAAYELMLKTCAAALQ